MFSEMMPINSIDIDAGVAERRIAIAVRSGNINTVAKPCNIRRHHGRVPAGCVGNKRSGIAEI
ncbi:hypothetical protein GCM10023156_07140 [Novipirellula rosea]|uniref:Uncharacterized protein n=1 Tax=Novipirellula rosea TaxID=1031540 RepID=A0ABP8M973_9BACT